MKRSILCLIVVAVFFVEFGYATEDKDIPVPWAQRAMGLGHAVEFLASKEGLKSVNVLIYDSRIDSEKLTNDLELTQELIECIENYTLNCTSILPTKPSAKKSKNDHGIQVARIVNTNKNNYFQEHIKIAGLFEKRTPMETLKYAIRDLLSEQKVDLVNVSLGSVAQEKQLDFQVPTIVGAGNYYPFKSSMAQNMDSVISVGSIDPWGNISMFSSDKVGTVIYAPSDSHLWVQDDLYFGGTSGAAPLVTKVTASLLSILPTLNAKQIQQILVKTGYKTIAMDIELGVDHEAVLVNAYRSVRLAWMMKERCREGAADCVLGEIDGNIEYYIDLLQVEAKQYYADGKYEKAFFLSPETSVYRKHMRENFTGTSMETFFALQKSDIDIRHIAKSKLLKAVRQRDLDKMRATIDAYGISFKDMQATYLASFLELDADEGVTYKTQKIRLDAVGIYFGMVSPTTFTEISDSVPYREFIKLLIDNKFNVDLYAGTVVNSYENFGLVRTVMLLPFLFEGEAFLHVLNQMLIENETKQWLEINFDKPYVSWGNHAGDQTLREFYMNYLVSLSTQGKETKKICQAMQRIDAKSLSVIELLKRMVPDLQTYSELRFFMECTGKTFLPGANISFLTLYPVLNDSDLAKNVRTVEDFLESKEKLRKELKKVTKARRYKNIVKTFDGFESLLQDFLDRS